MRLPSRAKIFQARDYLQNAAHFAGLGTVAGVSGYLAGPGIMALSALLVTGLLTTLVAAEKTINPRGSEVTADDTSGLSQAMAKANSQSPARKPVKLYVFAPRPDEKAFKTTAFGLINPRIEMSELAQKATEPDEKLAVIKHELTHIAAGHEKLSVAQFALQGQTAIMGLIMLGTGSFRTSLALGAAFLASRAIGKSLNLQNEFQADRGADPLAMIRFLRKAIAAENPGCNEEQPRSVPGLVLFRCLDLLSKRPDIELRLRKLEKTAVAQGHDPKLIEAALNTPYDGAKLIQQEPPKPREQGTPSDPNVRHTELPNPARVRVRQLV